MFQNKKRHLENNICMYQMFIYVWMYTMCMYAFVYNVYVHTDKCAYLM